MECGRQKLEQGSTSHREPVRDSGHSHSACPDSLWQSNKLSSVTNCPTTTFFSSASSYMRNMKGSERWPEKTGSVLTEAEVVASTFLTSTILYTLVHLSSYQSGCAQKRGGGGGGGGKAGCGRGKAECLASAFQRLWWHDGKAVWLRTWKALKSFRTTLQPVLCHLNVEPLENKYQDADISFRSHPPNTVGGPVSPVDMMPVDGEAKWFLAFTLHHHLSTSPIKPAGWRCDVR